MINDIAACVPNNDIRNMDPWQMIVSTAQALGMTLNKPNPSCKKCHGRGWIGRRHDSGEPIACSCIFPKETYDREIGEVQHKPANRAERRRAQK